MIPPTNRARENDGVLRKPIENATPDGIHFAHGKCRGVAYILNDAISAKIAAKTDMKMLLLSGSWPSPVNGQIKNTRFEYTSRLAIYVKQKERSHEGAEQGLAIHTPSAQGTTVRGWYTPADITNMLWL